MTSPGEGRGGGGHLKLIKKVTVRGWGCPQKVMSPYTKNKF